MSLKYLTYEDRKKLETLYVAGKKLTEIASMLNIHLSTVYREIARGYTGKIDNNGRYGYSSEIAQRVMQKTAKNRGHKKHSVGD